MFSMSLEDTTSILTLSHCAYCFWVWKIKIHWRSGHSHKEKRIVGEFVGNKWQLVKGGDCSYTLSMLTTFHKFFLVKVVAFYKFFLAQHTSWPESFFNSFPGEMRPSTYEYCVMLLRQFCVNNLLHVSGYRLYTSLICVGIYN